MRRTTLFEDLERDGRKLRWLARTTGYSESYLSLIRHGKRPVTDLFVRRLSERLDRRPETLFYNDASADVIQMPDGMEIHLPVRKRRMGASA